MTEYLDGLGNELTKKDQIKNGILYGTVGTHFISTGLYFAHDMVKDEDHKISTLEKSVTGLTIAAETAAYVGLDQLGIPAHVVPAFSNSFDTGMGVLSAIFTASMSNGKEAYFFPGGAIALFLYGMFSIEGTITGD